MKMMPRWMTSVRKTTMPAKKVRFRKMKPSKLRTCLTLQSPKPGIINRKGKRRSRKKLVMLKTWIKTYRDRLTWWKITKNSCRAKRSKPHDMISMNKVWKPTRYKLPI
jgi:hypothetical protein